MGTETNSDNNTILTFINSISVLLNILFFILGFIINFVYAYISRKNERDYQHKRILFDNTIIKNLPAYALFPSNLLNIINNYRGIFQKFQNELFQFKGISQSDSNNLENEQSNFEDCHNSITILYENFITSNVVITIFYDEMFRYNFHTICTNFYDEVTTLISNYVDESNENNFEIFLVEFRNAESCYINKLNKLIAEFSPSYQRTKVFVTMYRTGLFYLWKIGGVFKKPILIFKSTFFK